MDCSSAVLNDLVSDSSQDTVRQLEEFVKDKQVQRSWPERVILLTSDLCDAVQTPKVKIIANVLVHLLFDAKKQLDADGITDFILVTTRIMKKVWERLCYLLFSHVHNWMVIGVDVSDQDVHLPVPREGDIDLQVDNFLSSVESPEEVVMLKPTIFPQDIFNSGFSTRHGGVSSLEPLASLNLLHTIRKPDPEAVIRENRRRLAQKAGFDLNSLQVAKVEHGATIWVVEKSAERPLKYDGLVTNTPGTTVAAPGADCCIILLADPITGACGAVHAGWLGTVKGAVRSLLRTMIDEYGTNPSDVLGAIGPTIEANCFSLPVEAAKRITGLHPTLTWPHQRLPGLCHADLVKANAFMLEMDGVPKANMDMQFAKCTVCHKDLFFSHSRDGIPFGNQIGFIQRRLVNTNSDNELNKTE